MAAYQRSDVTSCGPLGAGPRCGMSPGCGRRWGMPGRAARSAQLMGQQKNNNKKGCTSHKPTNRTIPSEASEVSTRSSIFTLTTVGKICRFLRFFFFFLLLLLLYFVSELRESKTKKSKISFRKLPLILYRVLKTYWFVSDDQRKWTQKTPPSVRVRLSPAAASLLFGTRGACSRSPMWTWPEPPPPPPPREFSWSGAAYLTSSHPTPRFNDLCLELGFGEHFYTDRDKSLKYKTTCDLAIVFTSSRLSRVFDITFAGRVLHVCTCDDFAKTRAVRCIKPAVYKSETERGPERSCGINTQGS